MFDFSAFLFPCCFSTEEKNAGLMWKGKGNRGNKESFEGWKKQRRVGAKMNAQHFESNTILCKVCTKSDSYVVRCCVKGSLLEVNERLIKQPNLLNSLADREGYIAIIMPKPADWLKVKATLLGLEEYKRLKEQC
ncbi:hypothetical protein EUGRSUZ_F03727 [Eucalyptus grandis]|uniref:Uncharacterized protein n=2 Tax=Eucalyptus grandis TaxID=71139 RepID=A0ACC3KN92_EUCGR|nr:hypothetical protein EUGRSUZ_F03727 [Eucalyptus grandis]